MKSLSDWCVLHEVLDDTLDTDNINYKLRSWFRDDTTGYTQFVSFVDSCKKAHRVDIETARIYYSSFNKVKEFVDFINDDIEHTETEDYVDTFINIVRMLSGV